MTTPIIDWDDESGGGGGGGQADPSDVRAGVVYGPNDEFIGTYNGLAPWVNAGTLSQYSFEEFIARLDLYMRANLGNYIDQMNALKTDITLLKPADAAFYFQTVIDTEIPYDVFVYYGEVTTETIVNGPEHRERFKLMVAIVIGNSNEAKGVVGKRLIRYRECLKAMFRTGWNSIDSMVKLEVYGISPFPFSVTNEDVTHVGIGVNITMEIA